MKALAIATVSRSLALQSPRQWDVLNDLGFEITFAAGEDDYVEPLERRGTFVPLALERSIGLGNSRSIVREIKSLVEGSAWDLVQLQSPVAAAYGRMAIPRRRGYPVLYVVHGFHFHPDGKPYTNAAAFAAERMFVRRTDHVAVVAQWDLEAARRLGYAAEQVTLLPGAGVDLAAFGRPREHCGTGALLFVGDLNANKNPLLAIRLMVPLRAQLPTATLLVVGDGPLRTACSDLIAELGLEDSVQMLHRSDEVPLLMASSDCLISCSRREGLPRVVIEALAAGIGVAALANRCLLYTSPSPRD